MKWVVEEALDWGYWDTVPTRLKHSSMEKMRSHIASDDSISPAQLLAMNQPWFSNFLLHRRWRINRNNREKYRRSGSGGNLSLSTDSSFPGASEAAEVEVEDDDQVSEQSGPTIEAEASTAGTRWDTGRAKRPREVDDPAEEERSGIRLKSPSFVLRQ